LATSKREDTHEKAVLRRRLFKTVLLLKGYLCVCSCDVQKASRFLKEDTHFHHELGKCDREYAQEDRQSNTKGATEQELFTSSVITITLFSDGLTIL
jgi:hypothetical protein